MDKDSSSPQLVSDELNQIFLSDRPWSIEQHGIETIGAEERHGSTFELFWIWFAASIGILAVVYGALLTAIGLDLWQAIFAGMVGCAGSFVVVGILGIAGKQGGAPMLTLSRRPFGKRGNLGPTLVSWINLLGWEVIVTVTATYALLGLLNVVFGIHATTSWTVVSLLVMLALSLAVGILGHATIVQIQKIATWLFGGLTLVILPFLITKTHWSALSGAHPAPWGTVVAGIGIIAAGTGISWSNVSADYTRYLPKDESDKAIVWWTVLGSTLPTLILIIVGILLSSAIKGLSAASDPISSIQAVLPSWMAIPYLFAAIGGLLIETDLALYSSGLNLLVLGVKVKRYKTVAVDGAVIIAGGIAIMVVSNSFMAPFITFLELLAVALATWAAIFVVDMIRGSYDSSTPDNVGPIGKYLYYKGFNLPGLGSWLIGITIGLLFTASPWFSGPLAKGIFATSNLGYFIGAVVAAVVYVAYIRICAGYVQSKS
ncbi:MAG: cytosine permease [Actinobacteria bacterium]|nr:cytosine permease [Actinomycetota bacterium]MCL6105210.1 cytosine permease [Actinomycetota bacterium]